MPRAIVRAPGHDRSRSLGWLAADERRPEGHARCVGDGCTCQHRPVGDRQTK